jgi:3-deoxy-D-manno-octulosonic-acid transferase
VTTTTSTGAEQVAKFGFDIEHRYMPIDFSWCVNRFLRIIRPDLFIIVETELWPNTINSVAKKNIPIVLVNGRLSHKSAINYRKLRMLISPALNKLNCILTVHKDDKSRFDYLVENNARVQVTGSIKYDVNLDERTLALGSELRLELGIDRKILIAASTHLGEDEQVLKAYRLAKKDVPELLLVLVPRHPERFDSVATMVVDSGLKLARRTESAHSIDSSVDVYLGDSMGEMLVLMAASDLVFMGGSLLGKKVGGHNFIEPALLSKPCLTGPSYYNFLDLANQLISNNALEVICSPVELSKEVDALFSEPMKMISMGKSSHDIVLSNQGALQRTLNVINQVILKNPS